MVYYIKPLWEPSMRSCFTFLKHQIPLYYRYTAVDIWELRKYRYFLKFSRETKHLRNPILSTLSYMLAIIPPSSPMMLIPFHSS